MTAIKSAARDAISIDQEYELNDRYLRTEGRVFLTGTQALVRMPMAQAALDRANGMNTAGFISGYRGSPLGGYDQALWAARDQLDADRIKFVPALNEDLAATAVIGSQQVESDPKRDVDGVFGLWYGKGPGVDRSGDALKHGNAFGSSPHGGVLVVAGDDHGSVSSSMSHQSDQAFQSWFMPVLHPASVGEFLDYGLYGWALSRYSGLWVGFKAISETVESGASVEINPMPKFVTPTDYTAPDDGLHYRWPDLPGPQTEARIVHKLEAALAFVRANPIDRSIYNVPDARLGIVTTGKAYLDVMEALRLLGLDEAAVKRLGFDIYKVGLVYPLETDGLDAFMKGKEEILVIEEKRGVIEGQIKEHLFRQSGQASARVIGKTDEAGVELLPWTGELTPTMVSRVIAARLTNIFPDALFDEELAFNADSGVRAVTPEGAVRTPYFCAGCPHNTSTRVPEGSEAMAGIGCHFMASWMDRDTGLIAQMGGEGVNMVGKGPFVGDRHVFQNLGDGTFFHSGSMAIRQAIAAELNITYKILYNDAVAMTGGQPVDGNLSVSSISQLVRAEGVDRIAIVSDEPEKHKNPSHYPTGTTIHHRDDLDSVQREMRDLKGVSVLIYDQTCAAEKRRRRKRGEFPDPARRVFINEQLCEGCGDCALQSNCLAVIPVETPFGRKRRIDQSACNKDFACLNGFCPSLITIEGGQPRRRKGVGDGTALAQRVAKLPLPVLPKMVGVYDLLVGGVGGTGIITVGAVIAMAAHLEGKGSSVLDFMGFAQKGGSVLSYVRIGDSPDNINQVRIERGRADAMIACDVVVGTSPKALNVLRNGHTRILANTVVMPTADAIRNPDMDMDGPRRIELLREAVGADRVDALDAAYLAEALMGDSVFTNVFVLGYAYQSGLLPLSLDALLRAIELNGVAVDRNKDAFGWGRLAVVDMDFVTAASGRGDQTQADNTLGAILDRNAKFLTAYQGPAYAQKYLARIAKVRTAEERADIKADKLSITAAKTLFRLMAYKDEYEVARLFSDRAFKAQIEAAFEGDYKINYHMAPPILSQKVVSGAGDIKTRAKKQVFGAWATPLMAGLAKFRWLRGTAFDPFGYNPERKMERRLIDDYEKLLEELVETLDANRYDRAVEIAGVYASVRGFGPVKAHAVAKAEEQVKASMASFTGQPAAKDAA